MAARLRTHWRVLGVTCGLLLLCLAGYNYYRVYYAGTTRLTWSGAKVCAMRSEMAAHICSVVRSKGIELELQPRTTSEEICDAVNQHRLDIGLVLGGFPQDRYKNLRQIATLGVDPLHLLVRHELAVGQTPLEILRNRRVLLGARGTNSEMLCTQLMAFAGLRPTTSDHAGDFEPLYWRDAELCDRLEDWQQADTADRQVLAKALPDAVFAVAALPAPQVDVLVKTGLYKLMPLPYATALHLDVRRNHTGTVGGLESDRVEAVVIPAFTYGILPGVPAQDCRTIGLRRLLVANKDVPAHAVLRLLRALDSVEIRRYQIVLDANYQGNEFPLHPGATAFAQGRRPLVLGEFLEPMTNFFSVAGATGAGALALWGFLRNLRQVNPEIHLRQIGRIERLLQGTETDPTAPKAPLEFVSYLEARLAQIKQAAIDDYGHGRLDGDEALVGILTMVADTRHQLMQRRKQLCLRETIIPQQPQRMRDAA